MNRRGQGRSSRRMPGGSALWTPASLALTGWFREYPTFTGLEHWESSASAGVSGDGRDLFHGASGPSTGTALNGYRTAAFNGTTNSINANEGSGERLSACLNPSTWSFWCLCFSISADAPSGNVRADAALVDDSGQTFFQINYNTDGMNLSIVDTGGVKTATVACATGAYKLVQAYGNASVIGLRIDGGNWTTTSAGAINNALSGAGFYLRYGDAFSGEHWEGRIAESGLIDQVLDTATFDRIRSYCNRRYAVSV